MTTEWHVTDGHERSTDASCIYVRTDLLSGMRVTTHPQPLNHNAYPARIQAVAAILVHKQFSVAGSQGTASQAASPDKGAG
eukprot:11359962-Alexandrium_andersonii.AAC.1